MEEIRVVNEVTQVSVTIEESETKEINEEFVDLPIEGASDSSIPFQAPLTQIPETNQSSMISTVTHKHSQVHFEKIEVRDIVEVSTSAIQQVPTSAIEEDRIEAIYNELKAAEVVDCTVESGWSIFRSYTDEVAINRKAKKIFVVGQHIKDKRVKINEKNRDKRSSYILKFGHFERYGRDKIMCAVVNDLNEFDTIDLSFIVDFDSNVEVKHFDNIAQILQNFENWLQKSKPRRSSRIQHQQELQHQQQQHHKKKAHTKDEDSFEIEETVLQKEEEEEAKEEEEFENEISGLKRKHPTHATEHPHKKRTKTSNIEETALALGTPHQHHHQIVPSGDAQELDNQFPTPNVVMVQPIISTPSVVLLNPTVVFPSEI